MELTQEQMQGMANPVTSEQMQTIHDYVNSQYTSYHPPIKEMTYEYTAGALIRNQVKELIEKFCLKNDIKYSVKEFTHFLESDYVIKFYAEEYKIGSLKKWLGEIVEACK